MKTMLVGTGRRARAVRCAPWLGGFALALASCADAGDEDRGLADDVPAPPPAVAGMGAPLMPPPGEAMPGMSMSMTMQPGGDPGTDTGSQTPEAPVEDPMVMEPDMPIDDPGMTTGVPMGDPSDPATACPAPAADAPAAAVAALNTVNRARLAAGSVCATHIPEISVAAQRHCEYYAANEGDCVANPHGEVEGCTGYVSSSLGMRMELAGYQGRPASEVMAFANDPERAVQMWIDSVWHRVPVLDPWTTHMGYGAAEGCDTVDFGRGDPAPEDTVVVWPYADQVDVPLSFNGRYEGPMPPEPPTGWPSAYPVNVYARDFSVTEHVITVDGDDAPLDHVWLTPENSMLRSGVFMYVHQPFAANTTYRVRIVGTYVGGPLELEWTFTTGEERRRF